jgi:HlyD family secretion protein
MDAEANPNQSHHGKGNPMVAQKNSQKNNQLFRQTAIDRVASPDPIDYLVQVVPPKRWISFLGLSVLVAAGAAYAVWGGIPVTVNGTGVLVYPNETVSIQSSTTGRIQMVNVDVGKPVQKGQVLATIDQSELRQQLELAQTKLANLKQQESEAKLLQTQRIIQGTQAIAQQREALQNSLRILESTTPQIYSKGVDSIEGERQALKNRLATLTESLSVYANRRDAIGNLYSKEGAVPQTLALQAKREYEDLESQVDQVRVQLQQLDAKEAETQRQNLQTENQRNEIQAKLKSLDSGASTQVEQDLSTNTTRTKEIQATESEIKKIQLQLQKNSQIISDYDGTLTELTVKAGQLLQPGTPLGTIASHKPDAELVSVVFVPVRDNKNITPGMPVQITPSMVKREEFGSITGAVTQVSSLPLTPQTLASIVGNPDLLPGLLSKEAQIAVYTSLKPAPSTCKSQPCMKRYEWTSSQGPDQAMTPGMTTSVRIEVEKRPPISYLMPFLRELMKKN